jgi:hypothetical protein
MARAAAAAWHRYWWDSLESRDVPSTFASSHLVDGGDHCLPRRGAHDPDRRSVTLSATFPVLAAVFALIVAVGFRRLRGR